MGHIEAGYLNPLSWPEHAVSRSEADISPELLNTAGHELNHALVAMALGAKVVGISVEPRGNTLGVTTYAGSMNADQIQMIAMAGSVMAHDGHASGYGSDEYKAVRLAEVFGGLGVSRAKGLSEKIITSYPLEVREKVALMIVKEGHVSGTRLKHMLDTARREVQEKSSKVIPSGEHEWLLEAPYDAREVTRVGFLYNGNLLYRNSQDQE